MPGFDELLRHGVELQHSGRLTEAEPLYRQLLAMTAENAQLSRVWCNLGLVYAQQERWGEAIDAFQHSVRHDQGFADPWVNLGMIRTLQGDLPTARVCYEAAVRLNTRNAFAWNNYGVLLNKQGELDAARLAFEQAIVVQQIFPEALNNLGMIERLLGNVDRARICFHMAIEQRGDYAAAHEQLGMLELTQGEYRRVVEHLQRATQLAPHSAEAFNNLGSIYLRLGEVPLAAEAYARALQLPDAPSSAEDNALLCQLYRQGISLAELKSRHADWNARVAEPVRSVEPSWPNTPEPERRLRLGFVSADLVRHPIGHLLVHMLTAADRQQCELIAFSHGTRRDSVTDRLTQCFEAWHDVSKLNDEQLTTLVRQQQIDILFDLSGHTDGNRLLAFARRCAPLQVSWMGYPSTTGLAAMDYLIADRFTIPAEHDVHFVERVVRLPEGIACHEFPDDAPEVGLLPALQKGHLTLASFNNLAKLSPATIELWADVLQRVSGARLRLKFLGLHDPWLQERVRGHFARYGVDPQRLEFRGRSSLLEMLAEHHEVDLALDPMPYNGGTTTLLALFMGVPVVTLPTETFAGRQSLSALGQLGLDEWVARTPDEYVEIVARWANDLSGLATLRGSLRQRLLVSSYGDPQRFMRQWHVAIRELWNNWCHGQSRV